MTNRLEISWNLNGFVDEQRYYCSLAPINIESPPAAKVLLSGTVRTHTDTDVESDKTYYVCVSAVKNGIERFGEVKAIVTALGFRYYRILILSDNGRDQQTDIQEVEFALAPNGIDITTPSTPTNQSDYVIDGVPRTAAKTIDNEFTSINNIWTSAHNSPFPRWLSYDMGSNVKVIEVRVYPTYADTWGDFTGRAPKHMIIQGSLDGSTWLDIRDFPNVTGWIRGVPKRLNLTTGAVS